jgi:hypothetical protein
LNRRSQRKQRQEPKPKSSSDLCSLCDLLFKSLSLSSRLLNSVPVPASRPRPAAPSQSRCPVPMLSELPGIFVPLSEKGSPPPADILFFGPAGIFPTGQGGSDHDMCPVPVPMSRPSPVRWMVGPPPVCRASRGGARNRSAPSTRAVLGWPGQLACPGCEAARGHPESLKNEPSPSR